MSLFVVLRKTRYDKTNHFSMLQELVFIESGAPQSRLTAVYEHRFLPTFCILEKHGNQLQCGGDVGMF